MQEAPLHIDFDGEPIPDVMVVDGAQEDFETRHPVPQEVRLLIEIADASEGRDQNEKALLYAQTQIADYWVSLIGKKQVRVFRDPSPMGYQSDTIYQIGDVIAPLANPQKNIFVADLLPQSAAGTTP